MTEQFQTRELSCNTSESASTFVSYEAPVLGELIKQGVAAYLNQLSGAKPNNLYDMVIDTVEEPLLRLVMEYTNHNQVKAAKVLGVARGTLRTRLKKYGMIE